MRLLPRVCSAVVLLCFLASAAFAGHTERVNLASDGAVANNSCTDVRVSADGQCVVFESQATNLVLADPLNTSDVFLYSLPSGHVEAMSVASDGTRKTGDDPAISADGRYVAFRSYATDVVPGDTNGVADLFVHDRLTGSTERVSVATGGGEANDWSGRPDLSADGRYIVFGSAATNLVAGDTNGTFDVFVHDRQTGQTERVSVATGGVQATGGGSDEPSISADGRYVAFSSIASDLVPGDTNGWGDVFVHDRQTGETERVSVATGGVEAINGNSGTPYISADGRYVVFGSNAQNLTGGVGVDGVFVHDRQTGETTRVDVSSSGTPGSGMSSPTSAPTSDGRYIVFGSNATNLVDGDTNGANDVFLHDRQTGQTTRVNVANDGSEATGGSVWDGALSADGRYVAFGSTAQNLGALPVDGRPSVFVHDLTTGQNTLASPATPEANDAGLGPAISADGRYVAFCSKASNLVAADTNACLDVFVHDRQTGETTRVSVASDGTEGSWESQSPALSADGRYVAFASDAVNLVPDDTNGQRDIFIHDRQTETTERVSVPSGGGQADKPSYAPSLSADGRYVAFEGVATNLVAGDTNGVADVFVHDRQTGTIERVSVASGGGQAEGGGSMTASLSADGRYVAFDSNASNLVVGDTNGVGDVFVHDRQTGETTRVSVGAGGVQANGASSGPSISGDGRYVAFASSATNLIEGDINNQMDVFVHDRETGETRRASLAPGGQADGSSAWCSFSADGRYLAFASFATNLVADDTNGSQDVFVYHVESHGVSRVSVGPHGLQAFGDSLWPAISGDGRFVAFVSYATNLVAYDTNGYTDIFVRERPKAEFSGDPGAGIAPLTVAFTDLSTGEPTGWTWRFGDGESATTQNASHQYLRPSSYNVTLSVHDEVDSDSLTKPAYLWAGFPDVTVAPAPAHWAAYEVIACATAGIVQGYGDGLYHPEYTVTRDQMAVYISRALAGGDANVPEGPAVATFVDVPNTGYGPSGTDPYWAYKYIEYCVAHGVVQGYDPTHYGPTGAVTRDQIVVFVARAKGWVNIGEDMTAAPELFSDVPAGFWAGTAVQAGVDNGVVHGYSDGTYHPEYQVTRDQMAVFIARAFSLLL